VLNLEWGFFGLEFSAAEDVDDHDHAKNGGNQVSCKTNERIAEDKRLYAGGFFLKTSYVSLIVSYLLIL